MVNPLIVGGAALLLTASGFATGWKVNSWRHDAQELAVQQAADKAAQAVSNNAVTAIEGIEVRYVPVRAKAEVVTQTHVEYRECRHSADGLQILNAALSGAEPGSVATGMPEVEPAE